MRHWLAIVMLALAVGTQTAEAQDDPSWRELARWEGSSHLRTETVQITASAWRVTYELRPVNPWDQVCFAAVSDVTRRLVSSGCYSGAGAVDVIASPGPYHLEVQIFRGSWTVAVEELS